MKGNKRILAGELCVVDREFSNLRCLMNTLDSTAAACKELEARKG